MLIRVGFEAAFEFSEPTAVVLMAYLHPELSSKIRQLDRLTVMPEVVVTEFVDSFSNLSGRTLVPAGRVTFRTSALVENDGLADAQGWTAVQHQVQDMPNEVLPFLLPSRYCEVDSELRDIAWATFGKQPAGWPVVQSVCNFVHQHIRFDYMRARANRTALDVYRERAGVCRDYTHLAIAFCRSLNVPARYCTGYLGDIGVPIAADPMDFAAWFEVYLGGRWYTLDARNNTPRMGRILMARGRDAADVALTTTFGVNTLQSFQVWAEDVSGQPW